MKKIFLSGIYAMLALLLSNNFSWAGVPAWSVNSSDYEYSMTITAVLNIDGTIANEATDKVGAFINGVCVGVGSPSTFTNSDGNRLVFLTVYSHTVSGENVTFKLYDASLDIEPDAVNAVAFSNDATLGTIDAPYVITTNNDPTDINPGTFEFMEGQAVETTVGEFSATDPDVTAAFTYSLVSGTGDEDNNNFTVSGNSLLSAVLFDYEAKSAYSIRVRVGDGKGGVFEKQITVNILPDPDQFSALNYISPNGDNKNDQWKIANVDIYQDYNLSIFNDAGIVVFKTTQYQNDWEGTYQGNRLPTGVYYFLLENADGKKFTGSITLNR